MLSSLVLFLDKIIFHLIMLLIITRPKNKIPAFPAKAGEKPMVFQPNSEKGSFSSFSGISSRCGHPVFSVINKVAIIDFVLSSSHIMFKAPFTLYRIHLVPHS